MKTSCSRLVSRILLAAIATLLIGAVAGGTSFAVLVEEDIPAPSSGASPSPTANVGVGTASPAAVEASPSATFSATASSDATPAATNTPPPLDITSAGRTVQVSDDPLASELATSASPARSASIRTVEGARDQIVSGKADEAIRSLSRALSIDPTNPYVYFYLGRAYFMKKNYAQALTFLQRAEIGFSSNPAWLGETRGFEGAAYEESGRPAEAQVAYRHALESAPNSRIAVAGYGRLAASGYTGAPDGALPEVQAAPEVPAAPSGDWVIAPAPAMPPPPPPPAAEPPPPAE
jgi:Flp pilus assembly protein TadD